MPESHTTPPFPPIIALGLGIIAVSTAAVFIRYAQGYAPSLVIATYRLSLASLALAPIALLRHGDELRHLRRRELGLALLSGIFLAIHFATWITSLENTTIASSVVLVTTTPLWVALLSPFTVKEAIHRIVVIGLILALCGGIIIALSDACTRVGFSLTCPEIGDLLGGAALRADLLAVSGAVMAAIYLLIGRSIRSRLSLIPYIFLVYGMAAAALVFFTLLAGHKLFGYPMPAYVWFALLALIPQLFGHSTFNWALRYISAAFVSLTLLGEPIGSTILAYLVLGERPSAMKLFGAILILAGIYVASRSEAQQIQPENQSMEL